MRRRKTPDRAAGVTARPRVTVCADPASDRDLLKTAARVAVDLGLPLLRRPAKRGQDMLLTVTADRLELRVVGPNSALRGGRPIVSRLDRIDAASPAGGRLRQPLVRAVGIKKRSDPCPIIIDATAGYGEDAWLLATIGCPVLAVERNGVIVTLLRDAAFRAGVDQPRPLGRMHVVCADSYHLMRRILHHDPRRDEQLPRDMKSFVQPDVVYLDPMFPPGRKTAERKPLKVLRWLVGDDADADRVFEVALRLAARRVVVKRPLKAGPLGGRKPTTTHKGRSIRYDVYVPS